MKKNFLPKLAKSIAADSFLDLIFKNSISISFHKKGDFFWMINQ